jgi:hypothetical protein
MADLEVRKESLDTRECGVVDGEVNDDLVHDGPEELGSWNFWLVDVGTISHF